ncbi:MAG: 3'-5' exonuclease domain-containing protein 2 [Tannerella sp.]|jgi:ribonuclease D|nr:3'-5' exonuclease domain-containing protein 2 [Tannerella sp.]
MKNYLPSIAKAEIAGLPAEAFPGKIVVVDHPEVMKKAIAHLSSSGYVGFDTETRPNFSKHQHHIVSLMQISLNDTCYLFRLNRLGGIPKPLEHFLTDGNVTKIGLSLIDDFHSIRKLTSIDPVNFIDLQKLVPTFGIQDASLQKIYAILFGKKISKRAQLSNWEADVLTEPMQRYAALDAWACLRIYQLLTSPA